MRSMEGINGWDSFPPRSSRVHAMGSPSKGHSEGMLVRSSSKAACRCEQRSKQANATSLLPSSSTSSTRPCPRMMDFLRQSIFTCSSRLWSYLRQTGRVSGVVSEMQCNKCYLATATCPLICSWVLSAANSWSSSLSPVHARAAERTWV
jgi:hypothetical protein